MADLTPAAANTGGARTPDATPASTTLLTGALPASIAVGATLALVGLALVRLVGGWVPLAPDDARYLYVGLSVLDGQGPMTPSGDVYLQRSPVYGVALALGSQVLGGDPLDGAHLVAAAAALLGLIGAVRLAWLCAGPVAAIGTAIALAGVPVIWSLLPSLRIDLTQTALVVGLLLLARRPTTRRWAMAGVALGLVVLVKETALPLAALPVALATTVPGPTARRLAGVYLAAAALTAGWWWMLVFAASGQIFPANALAVAEARDVSGALRLAGTAVPLIAAAIVGWLVVARRAMSDLGARLLAMAAIGLVPAAAYAASLGLNARNYAGLAVLSAIAIGIGTAVLLGEIRARASAAPARTRSALVAVATVGMLVTAAALPIIGQTCVQRPGSDRLTDDIVAWVETHVPVGASITMSFREREAVAVRRFGRTDVRLLGARRVEADEDPATYLWMGLRDAQLFGYLRQSWVDGLTDVPASFLVLVGPHPFTPTALTERPAGDAGLPGLTPVATFDEGADHAEVLRVDPAAVASGTDEVALHLGADAALAWIDLASGPDGDDDAVGSLLAARPVISGEAIPALIERLGPRACVIQEDGATMFLAPAPTCPA